MAFKGERQEYTGYRVTSKKNGKTYQLGLGERTPYTVRYKVKVSYPNRQKSNTFFLGERYIREAIKNPPKN